MPNLHLILGKRRGALAAYLGSRLNRVCSSNYRIVILPNKAQNSPNERLADRERMFEPVFNPFFGT
jgi:hypothetical protein